MKDHLKGQEISEWKYEDAPKKYEQKIRKILEFQAEFLFLIFKFSFIFSIMKPW